MKIGWTKNTAVKFERVKWYVKVLNWIRSKL